MLLPEQDGVSYTCPCCGYPTLAERGGYEICEICNWEDDGQDDPHADEVWGGPNGDYSLSEARANFEAHLTMYRKNDKRFKRATASAHVQKKRKLIKRFDLQRRDSARGKEA